MICKIRSREQQCDSFNLFKFMNTVEVNFVIASKLSI